MSSEGAQNRLDKLRTKLKTDREANRSRGVLHKSDVSSLSKSSLVKLKKKEKNLLENISEDKKKKIQEMVLPAVKPKKDEISVPSKSIKVYSSDSSVAPTSKKMNAQMRLKKVVERRSEKSSSTAPHSSRPRKGDDKGPPLPPSNLKKLPRIPKKSQKAEEEGASSSKILTKTAACGKMKGPEAASRLLNPQFSTTSSLDKNDRNPKKPPELQKNLFKRKDGCSSEVSTSSRAKENSSNVPVLVAPTGEEKESEYGTSRFRQFLSKTCRGVVDALKETLSSGAEKISSYNFGRHNVTKQLQDVRSLVESVEVMDYEITCPTFESEQATLVLTDLFLVVDTNVIIKDLPLLKYLKSQKIKGMTPKVIIPWQVLKELDFLKEDRNKSSGGNPHGRNSIQHPARSGIRYILNELIKGDGYISGQPQHVASRTEDDFVIEVPDDHLIKCCLQLKWSGHNVLLLTNDKNLVVKAVVSDVPSMRCDEFSEICKDQSNYSKSTTCFEIAPTGEMASNHLACCSHRAALLLRHFLSAVLKKLWMFKFKNLWMLQSPGTEPWPLTVLLEQAYGLWNDISSRESEDISDVILFLRRFVNKMTYEKLESTDLDEFGRACHKLASSLPLSFGVEGVTFDRSLAFMKSPVDSESASDATFIGSCVSLTVHHFQLFEKKVVLYCYFVSESMGLPFSYPKVPPCLPEGTPSLNELSSHLSTVREIGTALIRLSSSPVEEITSRNQDVQSLHRTLVSYLGQSTDPKFVFQDVVDFCNDETMRNSFHSALQDLQNISTLLESAYCR